MSTIIREGKELPDQMKTSTSAAMEGESSSSSEWQEKPGEYVCKICYEMFAKCYRYPVSLNCGHTFCYYCIRKMARRTAIPCGICRKLTKTDYRELGKNITMMELLQDIGQLDDDSQSTPPVFEEPTDEVEPQEEIEWVPEPVIFEGIMEEAPTAEGMMRAIQSEDEEIDYQMRPGYNRLGLGPNDLSVPERRLRAMERFNRRAVHRHIEYLSPPPSSRLWDWSSSSGWGSSDEDEQQEEEQQNEAEVEQQQQVDEPEVQPEPPPTVHEHPPPPPQAQEEKAASSADRAKKVNTRVRVPEQAQVMPVNNRDHDANIPTVQRVPMNEENQSTEGRNVPARRIHVTNETGDRENVPPRRTRANRTNQVLDSPQVRAQEEVASEVREPVPARRAHRRVTNETCDREDVPAVQRVSVNKRGNTVADEVRALNLFTEVGPHRAGPSTSTNYGRRHGNRRRNRKRGGGEKLVV